MSIRKPPTPLSNAFEELDRVQPPRRKKPEAQYADFRQGAEAGDCAETDNNGSGPDFRASAQGMEDTEKPISGRNRSPSKTISPQCCQCAPR